MELSEKNSEDFRFIIDLMQTRGWIDHFVVNFSGGPTDYWTPEEWKLVSVTADTAEQSIAGSLSQS